ncbi:DUF2357 domain-containing protein [Luteimonas chenhongjianii]|uniref:DUF2357 domain-containing protein n=1 Tax=Luteimonas chenhongjianii TaxID=2006110 RepID=UPI0012FE3A4A|nr:DUF2357 domain-containing protein [Luteimonas chenhongjianii]
MSPSFELRYLSIDWRNPASARKVESAPAPISIERSGDEHVAETMIFKDRYAWVGLKLGVGPAAEVGSPPVLLSGVTRRPLLPIADPASNDEWWVLSDGWEPASRRHVSELRRSAGEFVFEIGGELLRVRNRLSDAGSTDIQAYVNDFTGSLLWMIVNDAAGATALGGVQVGSEKLVKALSSLEEAASRIVASPAGAIRETVDEVPISRLRVTAATFRRYAVNPGARSLPGRVRHESADTPENRYLRHTLALCITWAEAWATGVSTGNRFLRDLSDQEEQRAQENIAATCRTVDQALFDAQTESLASRLAALQNSLWDDVPEGAKIRAFEIVLGGPYGRSNGFFYERADRGPRDPQHPLAYRVVHLPDQVARLVGTVLHVGKHFTFEGVATSQEETDKKGKSFLRLKFTSVIKVTAHTSVLEHRASRRANLVENKWLVPIGASERRELAQEAEVSRRRAKAAQSQITSNGMALSEIERILGKLKLLDASLASMGVGSDSLFPMGMLYVSNPNYASCLRAFSKAEALFRAGGLDPGALDGLRRIGILHASDIYEKWCLLRVCMVLTEDLLFIGEPGWAERLVKASIGGLHNVRFKFVRTDLETAITVGYQCVTKLGFRPDILIWVSTRDSLSQQPHTSGLVLDAKFRVSWPLQGPSSELDSLIEQKMYAEAVPNARVFILQPCSSTVHPRASPLGWGSHCDYGARHAHRRGWIQMRAGTSRRAASENVKRLLCMALQEATPEPQTVRDGQWEASGLCVHCGQALGPGSTRGKKTKKGVSWTLLCGACKGSSIRTHCYVCSRPLFKNGTQLTYHETLAEQVTNVICPDCDAYFDEAWRSAAGD